MTSCQSRVRVLNLLKLIVRAQQGGLLRVILADGCDLPSWSGFTLGVAGRELASGGERGESDCQGTGAITDWSTVVTIGGLSQDRWLWGGHWSVRLGAKIVLRRLRVLSVLLVVRMEIVDSIVHYVPRIHRFFQTTRDTLHSHRSSITIRRVVALVNLLGQDYNMMINRTI